MHPSDLDPIKVARFWASLTITASDCWEWTQGSDTEGYGEVRIDRARFRAHRLAYLLTVGAIPNGMHVCHACDNPRCCNPKHLWLGTDADNQRDKWRKGRGVVPNLGSGELHPVAKLTRVQANEIRHVYAQGRTSFRKLSAYYGVSPSTIRNIVIGVSYPDQSAA